MYQLLVKSVYNFRFDENCEKLNGWKKLEVGFKKQKAFEKQIRTKWIRELQTFEHFRKAERRKKHKEL